MQATIRDWDDSEGGSAYRDDGTVVVVPAAALRMSPFRFLRAGQRVRLVVDEQETVVAVELP